MGSVLQRSAGRLAATRVTGVRLRQLLPTFVAAAFGAAADSKDVGGAQNEELSGAGKDYVPLRKHPALFDEAGWPTSWFDPEFLKLVQAAERGDDATFNALVTEEAPGVYSFPMVSDAFCSALLEELDGYRESGLPIRRPNSMNNYGIIVNEIGMRNAINAVQRRYVQPVARRLFPVQGLALDGHHSFMVQYKAGEDLGLDMHTDDSDVTLNLCLGREFTAAGLTFCGLSGREQHRKFSMRYSHVVGRAVLHLGMQRHGADDIETGERNNLIVWNWNSGYRSEGGNRAWGVVREDGPPDAECLSYTHDRDFAAYKDFKSPNDRAANIRTSWAPVGRACYDGMAEVIQTAQERRAAALVQDAQRKGPADEL